MTGIKHEDCDRCDGTGQITKTVAGRSGLVSSPNCDNVPKYAVPDDPPADPKARLDEILARRDELSEQKQQAKRLRSDVNDAREMLSGAADNDLMSDAAEAKLNHIAEQIRLVMREVDVIRGIGYEEEQLNREKAELHTLLKHIDEPEPEAAR
ncbi:hypothetical protein [Halococcus thailandensis]|uniref:Uncharacterized protein n=1 Tax=Halococcus thailandensis JCM 13552 TaxID=1227457 RepID=M0NFP7_9EURY|nr:hypothetical protein [Halococcus thailandensis]EMA56807.1 hypothetical protein C451_00335 [Halococcus thailandensis JCM 13552]